MVINNTFTDDGIQNGISYFTKSTMSETECIREFIIKKCVVVEKFLERNASFTHYANQSQLFA